MYMMMTFSKFDVTKDNTSSKITRNKIIKPLIILLLYINFTSNLAIAQLFEGSECELYDGSLGVCKSFADCKTAIADLNRGVIRYSQIQATRCSFSGSTEIICCGDDKHTGIRRTSKRPIISNEDLDDVQFLPEINNNYVNEAIIDNKKPIIIQSANVPATTTKLSISIPKVRTTTTITTRRTTTPRIPTTRPTTRRTTTTTRKTRTTTTKTYEILFNNPFVSSASIPSTTESFWSIWSPLRNPPTTKSINPTSNEQLNYDNEIDNFNITTTADGMSADLQEYKPSSNSMVGLFPIQNNNNNNKSNGDGSDNDEDFYNNYADRENQRTSSSTVEPPTTDVSTSPSNRIGDRKSEIACANYTSLVVPALSYHILGGKETQQGEFPHMAAIGFTTEDGGDDSLAFNCGGSIINEEYILTAAHCVNGRGLMPTVVRMGQINLLANSSFEPFVDRTITKITSHPNYSPSKKYDDIALIRVSPPITFDENIRPACLRTNTDDIDPAIPLIVTGWGSTSIERNQRSNILLKTNLTAVSIDQCNSSLLEYNPNNRALRSGIVLGQICAKDPTGTNDACQGDSGGPLQTVTEDGLSTIVGITSFGISCGSALPSVYSRVAFYIEWIESIAWSSV